MTHTQKACPIVLLKNLYSNITEVIKEMLTVRYSVKGSILRPAEEQTYIFFVDFLDECYG